MWLAFLAAVILLAFVRLLMSGSSQSAFSSCGSSSSQPSTGGGGGGGSAADPSLLWATPYVVSSDPDAPFQTIQAALTQIEADFPERAVVLIEAGVYAESLNFTSFGDVEITLTPLGVTSWGVGVTVEGSLTIAGSGSGTTQFTLDNVSIFASGADGATVTADGVVILEVVGATVQSDQNAVVVNDTTANGGRSIFRALENSRITATVGECLTLTAARVDARDSIFTASDAGARLVRATTGGTFCSLSFDRCSFEVANNAAAVPVFDLGNEAELRIRSQHPEVQPALTCGNRTVFNIQESATITIEQGTRIEAAPLDADDNAMFFVGGSVAFGTRIVCNNVALKTNRQVLVDTGGGFGPITVELYDSEIQAGAIGNVAPYGLQNTGGAISVNLFWENLRYSNDSSTDLTYFGPSGWIATPRTNTPTLIP